MKFEALDFPEDTAVRIEDSASASFLTAAVEDLVKVRQDQFNRELIDDYDTPILKRHLPDFEIEVIDLPDSRDLNHARFLVWVAGDLSYFGVNKVGIIFLPDGLQIVGHKRGANQEPLPETMVYDFLSSLAIEIQNDNKTTRQ